MHKTASTCTIGNLKADGDGTGSGGIISLYSSNDLTIGNGGTQLFARSGTTGGGTGGTILLRSTQGTLTIAPDAVIDVNARGGDGNGGTVVLDGAGLAVNKDINANGAGSGSGGQIIIGYDPYLPITTTLPYNINGNLTANAGATGASGGLIAVATTSPLSINGNITVNGGTVGTGGQIYVTATGAGNAIQIASSKLSAQGGTSAGDGGTIAVTSPDALTCTNTFITAGPSGSSKQGNGGAITLSAGGSGSGDLNFTGTLIADGEGAGNGGTVTATSISGNATFNNPGTGEAVTAYSGTGATGNGGTVMITAAQNLILGTGAGDSGGEVNVSSRALTGNGGAINLTAGSTGAGTLIYNDNIKADGGVGSGNGGTLMLTQASVNPLQVNGNITADGTGSSNLGGNITFQNTAGTDFNLNIAGREIADDPGTFVFTPGAGQNVFVTVTGTINAGSTINAQGQKLNGSIQATNNINLLTITGPQSGEILGDLNATANLVNIKLPVSLSVGTITANAGNVLISVPKLSILNSISAPNGSIFLRSASNSLTLSSEGTVAASLSTGSTGSIFIANGSLGDAVPFTQLTISGQLNLTGAPVLDAQTIVVASGAKLSAQIPTNGNATTSEMSIGVGTIRNGGTITAQQNILFAVPPPASAAEELDIMGTGNITSSAAVTVFQSTINDPNTNQPVNSATLSTTVENTVQGSSVEIDAFTLKVSAGGALNSGAGGIVLRSNQITNNGTINAGTGALAISGVANHPSTIVFRNGNYVPASDPLIIQGTGSLMANSVALNSRTGIVFVKQNSVSGNVSGGSAAGFLVSTATGNLTVQGVVSTGVTTASLQEGALFETDGGNLTVTAGGINGSSNVQLAGQGVILNGNITAGTTLAVSNAAGNSIAVGTGVSLIASNGALTLGGGTQQTSPTPPANFIPAVSNGGSITWPAQGLSAGGAVNVNALGQAVTFNTGQGTITFAGNDTVTAGSSSNGPLAPIACITIRDSDNRDSDQIWQSSNPFVSIVADHECYIQQSENGISMLSGSAIIRAQKTTTINCKDARFEVEKGTAVFIHVENDIMEVICLLDCAEHHVYALEAGIRKPLYSGHEIAYFEHKKAASMVLSRRFEQWNSDRNCANCEISMISLLGNTIMKALIHSQNRDDKLFISSLLKLSACRSIMDRTGRPFSSSSLKSTTILWN